MGILQAVYANPVGFALAVAGFVCGMLNLVLGLRAIQRTLPKRSLVKSLEAATEPIITTVQRSPIEQARWDARSKAFEAGGYRERQPGIFVKSAGPRLAD